MTFPIRITKQLKNIYQLSQLQVDKYQLFIIPNSTDLTEVRLIYIIKKGIFKDCIVWMKLKFPKEYPFKPPIISISMNSLHPTYTENPEGKLCCALEGIFCNYYRPKVTLQKIFQQFLIQIFETFKDPINYMF